jgi:hypothetical protein
VSGCRTEEESTRAVRDSALWNDHPGIGPSGAAPQIRNGLMENRVGSTVGAELDRASLLPDGKEWRLLNRS